MTLFQRVAAAGFCEAFGESVEWSFAWPGIGMAVACCALLTSDFAVEVVCGVSLAGPPGATPSTSARGSAVVADPAAAAALGRAVVFSLQPLTMTASVIAQARPSSLGVAQFIKFPDQA